MLHLDLTLFNSQVISTNITIREEVRHFLIWPGIAGSRLQDSAVMQLKVMRKTRVGCWHASYFRVACFIFATSLILAQAKHG